MRSKEIVNKEKKREKQEQRREGVMLSFVRSVLLKYREIETEPTHWRYETIGKDYEDIIRRAIKNEGSENKRSESDWNKRGGDKRE